VFVRVHRFAATGADLMVAASIEGRGLVASRRVTVPAGESLGVVMPADLPPDASGRAAVVHVELTRPDGETTILSFDPAQSDWPSQPGFVVFFRNLLERARDRRAAGGIAPGSLGEPLRVPAPDGTDVRATSPSGQAVSARARGGIAVVPVAAEPGVHLVRAGSRELFALRNLLDPAESDVRPRARFTEAGRGVDATAAEAHEHAESWPWVVAALLVLLVLEAWWATRRLRTAERAP
jgi:hypothetical protein